MRPLEIDLRPLVNVHMLCLVEKYGQRINDASQRDSIYSELTMTAAEEFTSCCCCCRRSGHLPLVVRPQRDHRRRRINTQQLQQPASVAAATFGAMEMALVRKPRKMRMGMRRNGGSQSSFVCLFFCSLLAADGVCQAPTMLRFLLITVLLRQDNLDGLAKEMNDDVIEKSVLSTAASPTSSNDVNGDVLPTPANVVEKITVARGTRAVLRCKVENIGAKTVVWRKEGEGNPLAIGLFPFAADARITADFSIRSNEWVLVIEDVRSDDEGVYFCQISTKVTHDTSQRTQLSVKSVSIEGLEYVEWGSQAQLVCGATGRPDPPPSVDWYKNGRRMRSDADRGVAITKNIERNMLVSVMTIQSVRMSDAAEYTCQASGSDHATVVLNVVRKTAAAEKIVSNINCGRGAVCWTINTGLIYSLALPTIVHIIVTAALQNTDATTS